MALLEKYLEVKESTIPGAGKGLFTKVAINKGTRIVEYKGTIKTWKEVKHHYNNYYIFYVNRNHVIDAQRSKKAVARFINHAHGFNKVLGIRNNAAFVIDGKNVFVDAIRHIAAGSEIFVSYGKDYWKVMKKNEEINAYEHKLAGA